MAKKKKPKESSYDKTRRKVFGLQKPYKKMLEKVGLNMSGKELKQLV